VISLRSFSLLVFLTAAVMFGLIINQLHPPKHLTLAAGPENGGYSKVADQYREILARDGITLNIVHTNGSMENAELLDARTVDAAILQGGIRVSDPEIEAIGTIFFEPMTFLVRWGAEIPENPARWRNQRIASGLPGSGTAAAFQDFEKAVGLRPDANQNLSLGYADAIAGLADETVDMAVFVAPIDTPYLVSAYAQSWLKFLPLRHSEAIARRLEYANTVTIPAGALSLDPVIPAASRRIIALEARLAVAPHLHPALVNRLTMAAIELHSTRGLISDPETFPSVKGTALPVNNVARQLILEGPSTWHSWLPYWMAAQVNRLFLLMLPIVFILVPLLRLLPAAYAYFMGWRVWQHYPEIRLIEEELDNVTDADIETLAQMDRQLVGLDDRLSRLRLPPAYRQASYDARMHIELVRKRIAALGEDEATA